jgi:hypothetical protein
LIPNIAHAVTELENGINTAKQHHSHKTKQHALPQKQAFQHETTKPILIRVEEDYLKIEREFRTSNTSFNFTLSQI